MSDKEKHQMYDKITKQPEFKKDWKKLDYGLVRSYLLNGKETTSKESITLKDSDEHEICISLTNKTFCKYSPYRNPTPFTYKEFLLIQKIFKQLEVKDE